MPDIPRGMVQVRAVFYPRIALPDDPDGDAVGDGKEIIFCAFPRRSEKCRLTSLPSGPRSASGPDPPPFPVGRVDILEDSSVMPSAKG
jgi:hypothetical protein